MISVTEELRAVGIALVGEDEQPALRAECARLARLLSERLVRTVGLIPAGDDVAVPAVALELGRALAERSALVGVVDALGAWPCARTFAQAASEDPGSAAVTSWLHDNLAVLTLRRASAAGQAVARLQALLEEKMGAFNHVVVDLTAFDHVGEQLAACDVLDAVALVARSGRTTTARVQRWMNELPDRRALGVLLTGL